MTRWALENDRVTAVVLVVLLLAGVRAFVTLPQAEDPGFPIRMAMVETVYPGASPERIEQLITDKLEKVIQEIPSLDYVASESTTGRSVLYVAIRDEIRELRPVWDDLRRKVERARAQLPSGVIGPRVDDEFGEVFGTIVGITGDGYSYEELEEVAEAVRNELLLLDDVAKVELSGLQEKRIFVEYRNARLAELGLSPTQLRQLLEAQNIIIPGGSVDTDLERIALEPTGNFETVDEIRRSVLRLPGRRDLVFLEDVARVSRGTIDPPTSLVRVDGEPAIGLAISMREGGNLVELGQAVQASIRRLETFYPIGVDFRFVAFQAAAVEQKVDDFVGNLLQSIGIVGAVMLLTLGLRTGLVVASLIPMAMLSALSMMALFGIGLDQMSLASLIIALGMLVDNAIVMSESVMVQMGEGKKPVAAALDSAAELRVPLLISSATTAAAFLPIVLAESTTGEYTAPLFKVVSITLLCSWLLSITMIPLLCVRFLRIEPVAERFDGPVYRNYRRILLAMLGRPFVSLAVVLAVFFSALQGFRFVPVIFFPTSDKPLFTAELELPIGTPIEHTDAIVREVEAFVAAELATGEGRSRGVTRWAAFVGRGAPRYVLGYDPTPPSPDFAYMLLTATDRAIVDDLVARLEAHCSATYPELKASVRPLSNGPPAWPPVAVRVSSPDTDALFRIVADVKAELGRIEGTKLIDDDWGPRSKKFLVRIDQPRAQRAGVTSQDVALSLQSFLSGFEATQFREGDDLVPVILRSVAADRRDLGKLESINIHSSTAPSVPLKQIADVEVVWQPAKVKRRGRVRTVTVESAVEGPLTAVDVVRHMQPWLESQAAAWGPGTSWEFGGAVETSRVANQSINDKLPIAGLLIALLLVGQFNSIRRPAIILLTVPLGLIGVVLGLLVGQSYFGFMTLLGIISLSGIVINNAIVLLDRIRIEIEDRGRAPDAAIFEAAQCRLRPILLTTATTIGGLLPLWLGGGAMWEPMALAIMFGLLVATALTLGVVPVLYALFFRVTCSAGPQADSREWNEGGL